MGDHVSQLICGILGLAYKNNETTTKQRQCRAKAQVMSNLSLERLIPNNKWLSYMCRFGLFAMHE